ncbi:MAG: S49 family peptidase [Moraxellaceae bacterium]|nr:MAG: S49 family peptidase [Moraxellaceae bacterium]
MEDESNNDVQSQTNSRPTAGGDGQGRDNRRGGNKRGNPRRHGPSKEWKLVEQLALQSLEEQKKSRRWGIFFKFATLLYVIFIFVAFRSEAGGGDGAKSYEPHTALVDVVGIIMAGREAEADVIVGGLRDAFEAKHSKAILLRINSPGGSPVQSNMVYNEIMRLKEKYPEKKVYAAITDAGASGAYFIAAAADAIYADPASIVGSIGVISDGFGFTKVMEKIGVERRVYSSGDNKAMLDPFSPLNAEQSAHFSSLLNNVHEQFIRAVRQGRGDRLKEDETIFSGLMWTGEQALELGLIDGLGSPGYVAREVVGVEEMVDYTQRPSPLQSIFDRIGVKIGITIAESLGSNFSLR